MSHQSPSVSSSYSVPSAMLFLCLMLYPGGQHGDPNSLPGKLSPSRLVAEFLMAPSHLPESESLLSIYPVPYKPPSCAVLGGLLSLVTLLRAGVPSYLSGIPDVAWREHINMY